MNVEFDSFVTINDQEYNIKVFGGYYPEEPQTRDYPGYPEVFEIWDVICLDDEGDFKREENITEFISPEDNERLKGEGVAWACAE